MFDFFVEESEKKGCAGKNFNTLEPGDGDVISVDLEATSDILKKAFHFGKDCCRGTPGTKSTIFIKMKEGIHLFILSPGAFETQALFWQQRPQPIKE